MNFTTPIEYNNYLIENKENIIIIDYVKQLNKILYNIDISFLEEFIKLVDKNECIIHHEMLKKYGILELKAGTAHVKRLFNQYELEENKDYKLSNVGEFSKEGKGNTNEYLLHPRAFKICLMRSKNTKLYAKYYLLLEECIKYFNDYQLELQRIYIIEYKNKISDQELNLKFKDNKIDELQKDLKELIKLNKRIDKRSRILEDQLNDANYKLDDVGADLEDTKSKLEQTFKKLKIASEKNVPEPQNKYKLEDFVLLKSRNKKLQYRYYAIWAQTKYADHKSEKMITIKNYKQLLRINNVNNSINLWQRLKEVTKEQVEFCGNELKLLTIEDNDLIEIINNVLDDEDEYSEDE